MPDPKIDDSQYFEIDLNDFKLHEDNGYLYFYLPDHPLSRKNGMVMAHRHVLSVHLGRWLKPNECVYFLNRNQKDISVENLKAVSRPELYQLIFQRGDGAVELICAQCGKSFTIVPSQAYKRRHCSQTCARKASYRFDVTPEELEILVWEMPTTHVAKMYCVSDKAVEKRCKKFGIRKPPPGYWAKMQWGKITPEMEDELRYGATQICKLT